MDIEPPVGIFQHPGFLIVAGEQNYHVHLIGKIHLVEFFIEILKIPVGFEPPEPLDEVLRRPHIVVAEHCQESSGNAMARNIEDVHPDIVIVDGINIIKIPGKPLAGHIFRKKKGALELEFFSRQNALLNSFGLVDFLHQRKIHRLNLCSPFVNNLLKVLGVEIHLALGTLQLLVGDADIVSEGGDVEKPKADGKYHGFHQKLIGRQRHEVFKSLGNEDNPQARGKITDVFVSLLEVEFQIEKNRCCQTGKLKHLELSSHRVVVDQQLPIAHHQGENDNHAQGDEKGNHFHDAGILVRYLVLGIQHTGQGDNDCENGEENLIVYHKHALGAGAQIKEKRVVKNLLHDFKNCINGKPDDKVEHSSSEMGEKGVIAGVENQQGDDDPHHLHQKTQLVDIESPVQIRFQSR